MRFFTSVLLVLIGSFAYSQVPMFSIGAVNNQFDITCASPAVTVYVSSVNFNGTLTSIWSGPGPVSVNGATATIFSPGNYTVKILFQNNSTLIVIPIGINTDVPTCTSNIASGVVTNANPPPFTFTAMSPTTTIIHNLYPPNQQSPISSTNVTMYYNPPFVAGTYTHCLVNTTSGCGTCMTFTFAPPLSVTGNSENDERVNIYPNPSKGIFYIKNTDSGTIVEIFNSLGEMVNFNSSFDQETIVNLEDQPKGIYLVKLTDKTRREVFLRVIRE